ncbi:bifunctional helix-turn-helix transcriptional regulator/GNAT family N-acetyltransferase [Acidocella sp. MX-AZ02]|uniref:bifunctional helix-turn-helix transcriptional regulator/GNAT family N-acetyltransferase n=1 Tax=Acidocella sp. MX-AZ02 TaxID=1214225 RepID=UPI00034D0260|nr:bifunctional helix-turn-helix transcriptional regulator/GNAT family N-acetyltransferase [Acidocella sp. MX-AZ02]
MSGDILKERPALFLASRLKRLAERMQGDVAALGGAVGLEIQPAQYSLLATLDAYGPQTIGELSQAMGLSQPAITRNAAKLAQMGLVAIDRLHKDQRHKTVSLTARGEADMACSKALVWPQVEAAVRDLLAGMETQFLAQIDAIETALAQKPLHQRFAPAGLRLLPFSDERAALFGAINREWIEAMYRLEPADLDVLDHPRARIIEKGGEIWFVEAQGLGVVGTCALLKTGEGQYELGKMGVLEAARGRKAGEFLLREMIARVRALGARRLYLLSNSRSAAAVHLYEKLGFRHDEGIMREFGARYERCNVAMLFPLSANGAKAAA